MQTLVSKHFLGKLVLGVVLIVEKCLGKTLTRPFTLTVISVACPTG